MTNTAGETLTTCTTSTMKWNITKTGGGTGATETVTADITETTFSNCTFSVNTLKKGAVEIHKIAGTSNGTVTADALEGSTTQTTVNTVLFGSCIYTVAAGKSWADLIEGKAAEEPSESTFKMNAVGTKVSGSSFACPETTKWTGTYVLTSPKGTTLSVSASVI